MDKFKSKIPYVFIFLIFLMLLIIVVHSVFLILIFNNAENPNKIFSKNSESVVELKAENENSVVSYGTAVIYNQDGYLVTNTHVVTFEQGENISEFEHYSIRFVFEEAYRKVELITYDIELDIAILKLADVSDLKIKPIKKGNSTKLCAGDSVYAIGNAMNQGISITRGIVSIPRINITYANKIREVIQSDVIISEGNSGGALLNSNGELIGITSFRIKDKDGEIVYGLAYSVPIDLVENVFSKIGL